MIIEIGMEETSTCHQLDNVSWSIGYSNTCIKRGGSDVRLIAMASNWLLEILYCHGGVLDYLLFLFSLRYVATPQHGSLSLYNKLEAHRFQNLISTSHNP